MKKPQKCVVALCIASARSVCVAHFILIHHSNKYVENVFHINSEQRNAERRRAANEKRQK